MKVLNLGWVKFEALQYDVKIVVTGNVREYEYSRGAESVRSPEASHMSDDNSSCIVFHPFSSAGTVAHECWHAVRNMLLSVQAELDNEVVAYHLSYLVDKITDRLYSQKTMDEMEKLKVCDFPKCAIQEEK